MKSRSVMLNSAIIRIVDFCAQYRWQVLAVGILLAALYNPVWTSAIHDRWDAAMALVAFGLLALARTPPILVVLLAAMTTWALPR